MIVTVGSINIDVIANVERLAKPGETVSGNGFATTPGGKGANQALAARRAGAETVMVGAVGNDAFAEGALALLKAGGVDLSRVRAVPEPTGVAVIMVASDGENVIAIISGANSKVANDQYGDLPFAKGDVLLLQLEIGFATVQAAIARARVYGATSILNIAPFHPDAVAMMAQADISIANETEFADAATAMALTGETLESRMRDFAKRTQRTIIVTLGSEGAAAAFGNGFHAVPSLKITPVDTVGAGDTFCGYLAAGLHAGLALPDAMRLAAAAGSLACLKPGAQPSIPRLDDVQAALA
jgi:ribokinase